MKVHHSNSSICSSKCLSPRCRRAAAAATATTAAAEAKAPHVATETEKARGAKGAECPRSQSSRIRFSEPGQPKPLWLQHHSCLAGNHTICHMSKPSWQLKGSRFGPAAEVDFGTVLGRGVEVGTFAAPRQALLTGQRSQRPLHSRRTKAWANWQGDVSPKKVCTEAKWILSSQVTSTFSKVQVLWQPGKVLVSVVVLVLVLMVVVGGHPRFVFLQHQIFLPGDQPWTQFM